MKADFSESSTGRLKHFESGGGIGPSLAKGHLRPPKSVPGLIVHEELIKN